jgi:uncharacterized protein YunC (DUF1805 family)
MIIILYANHHYRRDMEQVKVSLTRKIADGYIIPLGPANLVAVMTDIGMVGCGAFDVAALDSFSYPAAKVRPSIGPIIVDTDDILKGIIKEANRSAIGRGIRTGMTGREALELL